MGSDGNNATEGRRFISLRDAARRTAFSYATLRRWIVARRLTAYKPGGKIVVEVEQLDRLVLEAARLESINARPAPRTFLPNPILPAL
jgi:excisionase family DNA binding protein